LCPISKARNWSKASEGLMLGARCSPTTWRR
jgi:hypothetical protein